MAILTPQKLRFRSIEVTVLRGNQPRQPAAQAASTRLRQLRAGGMPDAGGLVIATDQTVARDYAELLTAITGTRPTLVLSDDPKSSSRIAEFAASRDEWMVAVRMVSEGVDVPALDAIMFMHPRKSQIDVVQSVGRVMRRAEGKKMGYVILPVAILGLLLSLRIWNAKPRSPSR